MAENEKSDAPLLQIGTDAKTVDKVNGAIMDILRSGAEQETLRQALVVLSRAVSISDVVVSNNTFTHG